MAQETALPRFADLDALQAAVGTHLGFGPWFVIDQGRVDVFADATIDDQWIHVDPVQAKEGPFGATVAHGFLTLSLIPYLVGDLLSVGGLSLEVNYGLNKVRFPSPVVTGSRVRAGVELLEARRGPQGAQAVMKVVVEIEDAPKPAVVAEWVLLLVP